MKTRLRLREWRNSCGECRRTGRVRDHVKRMNDQRPDDVLGALPRRRPHRRSEKRPARPVRTRDTAAWREPVSARPIRSHPARSSAPAIGADILGTAVRAAAELAEIGLSAGARALRNAIARLPRP
jgi:hypothetical protein